MQFAVLEPLFDRTGLSLDDKLGAELILPFTSALVLVLWYLFFGFDPTAVLVTHKFNSKLEKLVSLLWLPCHHNIWNDHISVGFFSDKGLLYFFLKWNLEQVPTYFIWLKVSLDTLIHQFYKSFLPFLMDPRWRTCSVTFSPLFIGHDNWLTVDLDSIDNDIPHIWLQLHNRTAQCLIL